MYENGNCMYEECFSAKEKAFVRHVSDSSDALCSQYEMAMVDAVSAVDENFCISTQQKA